MDAYERRMNALRHGELLPAGDELTYDANADLKAHSSAHKRKAIEQESYLSKERLMELRKVQNERVEVRLSPSNSVVSPSLTLTCRLGR